MIQAKFKPIWRNISNLGSYAEGAAVSIPLAYGNMAVVTLQSRTNVVDCGAYASGVTTVEIDGVATSFDVIGTDIVFPSSPAGAVIDFYASSQTDTVSLLCGDLPAGLSVTATGVIHGAVGAMAVGVTPYEFVLRLTNPSGDVADMLFKISCSSVQASETFDTSQLPAAITDSVLGISYIPLGRYQPSEAISHTIDVLAHGAPAPMEIDKTFFIINNEHAEFTGPPSHITLSGATLTGQVAADTDIGKYFFKLIFSGMFNKLELIFCIEVIPYAYVVYKPPVTMKWVTAPDLGALTEGYPSCLTLLATAHAYDAEVVYSLARYSLDLPPGLSIAANGALVGAPAYGQTATTFSFTVRATAGAMFIDRTFTLQIKRQYSVTSIYNIVFEFDVLDAANFTNPYRALIPESSLYRPADALFGLRDPEIYLLAGLDGSLDISSITAPETSPIVGPTSYFSTISFLLGEHASVTVLDNTGAPLYDLLYRVIYEFEAGAGGFKGGDTPIADPVTLGQSYVYPTCVHNMRAKLVSTFWFPTIERDLANTMGIYGGEMLPQWMISAGGYHLAVPVAFVKAGAGASLAIVLNESSEPVSNGYEYTFNRLRLIGGSLNYLQFRN